CGLGKSLKGCQTNTKDTHYPQHNCSSRLLELSSRSPHRSSPLAAVCYSGLSPPWRRRSRIQGKAAIRGLRLGVASAPGPGQRDELRLGTDGYGDGAVRLTSRFGVYRKVLSLHSPFMAIATGGIQSGQNWAFDPCKRTSKTPQPSQNLSSRGLTTSEECRDS